MAFKNLCLHLTVATVALLLAPGCGNLSNEAASPMSAAGSTGVNSKLIPGSAADVSGFGPLPISTNQASGAFLDSRNINLGQSGAAGRPGTTLGGAAGNGGGGSGNMGGIAGSAPIGGAAGAHMGGAPNAQAGTAGAGAPG